MTSDRPEAGDPTADSVLRAKQREFLETFLRKGTEFTEELIRENERLRFRVAELEATAGGVDSGQQTAALLRDLARRIESLEAERDDLLQRFHRASEESRAVERRYADVENENGRLASLYVAATQLHTTLDLYEVLQVIHEILLNFIGAKTFALLFQDGSTGPLVALATEGIDPQAAIPADAGPIADALRDAASRLDGPLHGGGLDLRRPAVCVPLLLGSRPVGALAVWEFLAQKESLSEVDAELLRLLGMHAARAIVSARLYVEAGQPSVEAGRCAARLAGKE